MAAKKKVAKAAKPRRPVKPKHHGHRADLGSAVAPFIAELTGETRAIAERLRAIVQREVPAVNEAIKWGMPVYEHHGLLCYIAPRAKYVGFGFYKAAGFDDPDGLLQGSGLGGQVKIARAKDIPEARIAGWLKQAVAFNVARAG
jgi:hypothetical protein